MYLPTNPNNAFQRGSVFLCSFQCVTGSCDAALAAGVFWVFFLTVNWVHKAACVSLHPLRSVVFG